MKGGGHDNYPDDDDDAAGDDDDDDGDDEDGENLLTTLIWSAVRHCWRSCALLTINGVGCLTVGMIIDHMDDDDRADDSDDHVFVDDHSNLLFQSCVGRNWIWRFFACFPSEINCI